MNVASTIMGGMIFIIAFVSSKLKKKYFPNSVLLSCIPSIMILFGTFISIMFNLNDKYDLKSAKDIPSGYPLPSWPVINFNLL
jgi:MFS superfamily sulfate permease-like transporter